MGSTFQFLCCALQVYKALRGGEHPIAIREFRHQLSEQERGQLQRLVKQLCSCKDRCFPPCNIHRAASPRSPMMARLPSACAGPYRGWAQCVDSDVQLLKHVCDITRRRCLSALRHIVRLLESAPAPGEGGGLLIASPLRARQRLSSALAGPHAEEFLWYRRRCARRTPALLGAWWCITSV